MKFILPFIASIIGIMPLSPTATVERAKPVEVNVTLSSPKELLGYTAIILKNGFILSEAFVDGQKGIFIIDTGAPQLILNANKFPTTEIKTEAAGISSALTIGQQKVKSFHWSGLQEKNIEALVVELDHLEESLGMPIMGLIGYEVLKEHELLIDYDNSIAQLFKTTRLTFHESVVTEIPFTLDEHLPVIEARIGNKQLRLGLDTGAASNLIDEAFAKKIKLKGDLKKEEIRGLDKKIQQTTSVNISSTVISGNDFEGMRYLLYPLKKKCTDFNINIDGLLGYPFFSKGKFSIDYKRKKLSFFHPSDKSTDPDSQNTARSLKSLALNNSRPQ